MRSYPQPLTQPRVRKLETLVEPDIEIDYSLADAKDYACEWVVPPCSNEAVRMLHMKAAAGQESDDVCRCARKILSCLPCMERVIEPGGQTVCTRCRGLMEVRSSEVIR